MLKWITIEAANDEDFAGFSGLILVFTSHGLRSGLLFQYFSAVKTFLVLAELSPCTTVGSNQWYTLIIALCCTVYKLYPFCHLF